MTVIQNTEADQFALWAVSTSLSQSLKSYVENYKSTRRAFLGLFPSAATAQTRIQQINAARKANDQTPINPANVPVNQFPSVNLRQRIALAAANFAPIFAANGNIKAALENEVNSFVLPTIGGASAISPTGVWSWLLEPDWENDPTGKTLLYFKTPGVFALPGNPFTYTQTNTINGQSVTTVFTVTLGISDGTTAVPGYGGAGQPALPAAGLGWVTYSTEAGVWTGPDPL